MDTLQIRRSLKESLPDRQVLIKQFTESYIGETRVYRKGQTYHADKNCPYFPAGWMYVYPISTARDAIAYDICDYCTVGE